MSLWIKICGNTSAADALLAVEAGADAVGFVFAASPRHVTTSEVAGIVARLPKTVETIGVFVDAGVEEIYSAVRMCHLTGVQLHWDAAADLPGRLKDHLGHGLRVLRVAHFGVGKPNQAATQVAAQAAAYEKDPNVDGLLIDSRTAAAAGGTGVAYDWKAAAESIFQNAQARKLVVAGGLTPENVGEAIATLRPWGVDVVSGVEAEVGRKDALKVREFMTRARAAEAELAALSET
jgi:phosphoribosylanthranilate isomerase